MRRVVGTVLVALGAFLIVVAILLPTYVASALVKTPLDQYSTTTATASGATVFDAATLSERQGVDLEATRAVRSDTKRGSVDRVVLDVFVRVTDGSGKELTLTSDRVATDRRTGEAIACCDESVNGAPVAHKGLTYKFPIGTEKRDYTYFDITAKRPYKARYVRTERINGLSTYLFQVAVDPVKVSELEVPGSLVKSDKPSVTVDRYYTNLRSIWVEPDSGVIVKGQEEQKQTLRDENGEDAVTVLEANLVFDDETIKKQVAAAQSSKGTIARLTSILPLVAGLFGVVMLLAGIALLLRPADASAAHAPPQPPNPGSPGHVAGAPTTGASVPHD